MAYRYKKHYRLGESEMSLCNRHVKPDQIVKEGATCKDCLVLRIRQIEREATEWLKQPE